MRPTPNTSTLPCIFYRMTQHPPPSPFSKVSKAALVAASKTSSTPSPVNEEHSRYFLAPISCPTSVASLLVTKRSDFLRISSIATGSSRKSFFNPTNMIGTSGHRSLASSTHYVRSIIYAPGTQNRPTLCLTLSKESGVSIAKPIKMTCAFAYARGLSLS